MELPGSRKANLREARISKVYPTRELHFQIVPNAGEADTSKFSGFGRVWKCRVGWAQVGSAGFSRAGHNSNAPASRELGTIWKCNLRVRHNLEAQLAGWAQFGNARFSRACYELETLISRELCAIWTRSSQAGRNLEVQPGCARLYTACPLLAGWAEFTSAARVGHNVDAQLAR